MDRPKDLNAISTTGQWEMDSVWKWFDQEETPSVAIITDTGLPQGWETASAERAVE